MLLSATAEIDLDHIKSRKLKVTFKLGEGKQLESMLHHEPKSIESSDEFKAMADLNFMNKRTFKIVQHIQSSKKAKELRSAIKGVMNIKATVNARAAEYKSVDDAAL